MNWTYIYNGFHGRAAITVRVPAGSVDGNVVRISERTADRIKRQVCGASDCKCGESGGVSRYWGRGGEPQSEIRLPSLTADLRGNYPQD